MIKHLMLLASLFITAHLAACSSGGGVAAPGQASYATLEQLAQSPCNALNIGATAIVESENAIYACVGDVSTGVYGWEYSGEANHPPVENPVNENPVNNPVNENPVSQNPVLSSASAPYYPEFELSPTPSSSSVALTPGSQFNPNIVYGSMTDSRDGKTYRTVVIGSQAWMAQNLNYETTGSMCYGNLEENCAMYGRLYAWEEAMEACPSGWHLPSYNEWEILFTAVGGNFNVGNALKSQSGWGNYGNGTDTFGFSALPSGDRFYGSFDCDGYYAFFWSSTELNSYYAYFMYLCHDYDNGGLYDYHKSYGFSVRCLRDY